MIQENDYRRSKENENFKGLRMLFVRSFWPGGGLENAVSAVLDMLKSDIGVAPVLVLNGDPKGKIPNCEVITLDMGPVGDLPLKGHPVNIARYLVRMLIYAYRLKDKLRHNKFEILVALEPEMAAMLKRLFPKKLVVIWFHGSLKVTSRRGVWPMVRVGLKEADAIIVLNQSMIKELEVLYPTAVPKSFVLHNPVKLNEHDGVYVPGSRTIAYVGRIQNVQKRLDRLLKAFDIFWENHKTWRLLVVGDGPDMVEVERLTKEINAAENVHLAGWQEDPWEYIAEIGGAEFLALTSDFEGSPLTIIEAMMYGVPVVALDCPVGPSDIIVNNKNGILVPFGSAETITIHNLASAFSQIAEALVSFDGTFIKQSVKEYLPSSVKVEWEAFLSALQERFHKSL